MVYYQEKQLVLLSPLKDNGWGLDGSLGENNIQLSSEIHDRQNDVLNKS